MEQDRLYRVPDESVGSFSLRIEGAVNDIIGRRIPSKGALATLAYLLMDASRVGNDYATSQRCLLRAREFLAQGSISDEARKYFRQRCEGAPRRNDERIQYLLDGPMRV